jgi:hypothetical protein
MDKLRRAANVPDIMRIEALWGALSYGSLTGPATKVRSVFREHARG